MRGTGRNDGLLAAAFGARCFRAGPPLMCAVVLLLSGCVYLSRHTLPGACSDDLGSPIRNFCVVTPGVLWRAEAPTRSDARWLVAHGVGSVVSLGLDVRRSFESAHVYPGRARSVTYYELDDFSAMQVLTHRHLDEHVALALAIIREAPKPVLVNCRAGVDRTGIVVAAYRMLVDGVSAKRAIAQMNRFHSPWDPLNDRYVRSLSGARGAKILRRAKQWETSGVGPSGSFRCQGGGCRFVRR
ncbi:MAG: dual specificity protein phosphatase family protein [Proteobacteria bacterium]|nr:dual specificity protein phosphatase family protein [Pseudomonadota bacterium]